MAQIDLLEEIIKIASSSTKALRAELNTRVHVVDLNFDALIKGDPQLQDYEYYDIIQSVADNFFNAPSLEVALKKIKDKSNTELYVDDPKFGHFFVASNYAKAQSSLAYVLKNIRGVSELLGTDTSGNAVANIGHMVDPKSQLDNTSPFAAKLEAIRRLTKNRPKAYADVSSFIEELYAIHNPYVETSINIVEERGLPGEFRKILGKHTIVVTLQSKNVNQGLLAKAEKDIADRLKKRVSGYEFSEYLLNKKGSNSILEDIEQTLLNQLDPKAYKKPKLHSTKSSNAKVEKVQGSLSITTSKAPVKPRLRNSRGHFVSPIALQNLLNKDLASQIQKNMGKGNAKTVLNYRTGRFAESAHVSNILIRDGHVDAFYSYMKNPYATFEPSGQQGFPTSRDPRKLIEKSIRQIAGTIMTNRLRAIPQ